MPPLIQRQAIVPNPRRVVVLPFQMSIHAREVASTVLTRIKRICGAIQSMDDEQCQQALGKLRTSFSGRHPDLTQIFTDRFLQIKSMAGLAEVNAAHAELIGAYFSHEYSYQAAAVLNPSAVRHPDQSGLEPGETRFVLSTRCIGEGHISTVAFREGVVHADGQVTLLPASELSLAAIPVSRVADSEPISVRRAAGTALSQTVIFPVTRSQTNGIEDLRLTAFDDGGQTRYIGTYTAFSGRDVRCERLETSDFETFTLSPLRGEASFHKALAFFPRKINGRFAAIGRLDHESLFYLESDDLSTWESGSKIITPEADWELMQVGNCGSPIELEEGWLVITHGVGPIRQYALGAALLDKSDPRRVLGRTKQPILTPQSDGKDGYAPNAMYSCGSLRSGDWLFVPYAIADTQIEFATFKISELLSALS